MRRNGREQKMGIAARRGAVAGAVGSAAMVAALRLENAVVPRRDRMTPPWVRLTEAVLDRLDLELSPTATHALGAVLHAAYGAIAGASYGMLDRRVFRRRPWGNAFLIAALLYVTGYLRGGLQHRAGAFSPPSRQRTPRALIPVGLHVVFASTMAAAFVLLEARAPSTPRHRRSASTYRAAERSSAARAPRSMRRSHHAP